MAFSRSFLKNLGLTDEQITAVIEEHVAVTDALKQQRDGYKADADKLADVQKQLDEAKAGEDFKAKYEQTQKEFDAYKAQIAQEAETAKIQAAYRELLRAEKINEKRFDVVCRATDFSGMKLGKDGTLQNADALKEAIRKDWADFKVTQETKGADVQTPPAGNSSKRSKEEIMAIKDTGERQRAIAENHELFGF